MATRSNSSQSPSSRAAMDDHIDIPTHRQQEMLNTINATIASVLKSMVGGGPSNVYWRPKGKKRGISYFVDENVTASQYRFCCVSEAAASVQDVMKLLIMTDTDTLLKNYRVVYNNVLDARVLSVISHPTKSDPYKSVYLRYSCFAAPRMMADRDMCLVVATDVFSHVDGSTIGYCLWDSVELPECPDYSDEGGQVLRSRMFKSGFFLRSSPDNPNVTKIVYLVGTEAGGIAPRLTMKLCVDRFGANLVRLCGYFRRRNLDATSFVSREDWCSKSSARMCRCCEKKFHTLSSRANCVACGAVVCKQCVTKEKVDIPGAGLTAAHICTSCLGARGVDVDADTESENSFLTQSQERSMTESRQYNR